MSNLNERIEFSGLTRGGICTYQMEVPNNQLSDKLVEIEINRVANVRVAIDFTQWQDDANTTQVIETGFLQAWNCSADVNCTKNMRGNHVYYLSGVKTLYLTVVSTGGGDSNSFSDSSASISLDFTIRERVKSAGLQIGICILLLTLFAIGFSKSVVWMRSMMEQELSLKQQLDTENLDSIGTKSDQGSFDANDDNLRKS